MGRILYLFMGLNESFPVRESHPFKPCNYFSNNFNVDNSGDSKILIGSKTSMNTAPPLDFPTIN